MVVVDPRNLPVKFGQNQVNNNWDIVVAVVFIVVSDVVDVDLILVVAVHPRNLPLKFGQNRICNSWDIDDFEFPPGDGVKSFLCQPQLLLC